MPQIDFYVIKDSAPQSALRTACGIAEKAYQRGFSIHIKTNDDDEAEALDVLLWTFRDRSFIPHEFYPASSMPMCTVTIGTVNDPAEAEVLINVSCQTPGNVANFQKIAEVIDAQPESIRAGRERYRCYRKQGYEPRHHEVFSHQQIRH